MLNTGGPSGFRSAPVTKCLIMVVTTMTIMTALLQWNYLFVLQPSLILRHGQLWRLLIHQLPFTSSGEALLGMILLYFIRMFERRYGSMKYISMMTIVSLFSTSIEMMILLTIGRGTSLTLRKPGKPSSITTTTSSYYEMRPASVPGPYGIIYAFLVGYLYEIPVTYRFRLGGGRVGGGGHRFSLLNSITISDKSLVYLIALQMAFTRGKASLVSASAGFLAGLLYRSNLGHVKQWRYPISLAHSIQSILGPFLLINSTTDTSRLATTANQRGEGGDQRAASSTLIFPRPVAIRQDLLNSMDSMRIPAISPLSSSPSTIVPSNEHIEHLMSMGFSREAATQALIRTRNNLQRASNLLIDN